MARRADPKRIFVARRMAVRNVLASEGMAVETADAWCDAWQDEDDRLGLDRMSSEYWTLGLAWTHEQRKARKLPIYVGSGGPWRVAFPWIGAETSG